MIELTRDQVHTVLIALMSTDDDVRLRAAAVVLDALLRGPDAAPPALLDAGGGAPLPWRTDGGGVFDANDQLLFEVVVASGGATSTAEIVASMIACVMNGAPQASAAGPVLAPLPWSANRSVAFDGDGERLFRVFTDYRSVGDDMLLAEIIVATVNASACAKTELPRGGPLT